MNDVHLKDGKTMQLSSVSVANHSHVALRLAAEQYAKHAAFISIVIAMALVLSRPPIIDEFPPSKTFPWIGMILMLTLAIETPGLAKRKSGNQSAAPILRPNHPDITKAEHDP